MPRDYFKGIKGAELLTEAERLELLQIAKNEAKVRPVSAGWAIVNDILTLIASGAVAYLAVGKILEFLTDRLVS
jgi:hypothetical protein